MINYQIDSKGNNSDLEFKISDRKRMLHNGFDHGKHTEWYENGQKKSVRYFIDGIPTGIWKEWDKNGKLIKSRRMN